MDQLRITEIFFSLQGETKTVGIPTVFVRLTGCPLRCQYCDTAYAFQGGTLWKLDDVLQEVKKYNAKHVTVTGGEPLAQKNCNVLMTNLCDAGFIVSLETSGALDIANVDHRVIKVIDLKTPASGEVKKNKWENLNYLLPQDQIKFVICDENDYVWSKEMIDQYQLTTKCEILFSPSYHQMPAKDLANWILRDQLSVRLQIQLHKFLWGDVAGK